MSTQRITVVVELDNSNTQLAEQIRWALVEVAYLVDGQTDVTSNVQEVPE